MERKFELSRAIYKLELNSQFSLTALRCVCFRMELVGCSFTVLLVRNACAHMFGVRWRVYTLHSYVCVWRAFGSQPSLPLVIGWALSTGRGAQRYIEKFYLGGSIHKCERIYNSHAVIHWMHCYIFKQIPRDRKHNFNDMPFPVTYYLLYIGFFGGKWKVSFIVAKFTLEFQTISDRKNTFARSTKFEGKVSQEMFSK